MRSWVEWLVVALAWMVGAFGGGAALARLYKRLHPELAFYKLWALWTMLLAAAATLVFGLGVL
ncbi:MAG TPA: hypothetical protein VHG28_06975 [Longimicrobiaceae bacterium]|nr:hypothetical protein [Longimicrobiaceae bacterium]